MKSIIQCLLASPLLGGMMLLTSCVDTRIIEPETPLIDNSSKIVLNLSAPEDATTRATDGFKLRFVAKIFNGSESNLNDTYYKARQELVQGEAGPAGKIDQMVFDVEANQNYIIYVFADYIPVDSKPSEEGYYEDYYYDTRNSGNTGVTLMSTPKQLSNQAVPASFFNNDNYDCFAGTENIGKKGEDAIYRTITLERIVSKVRFVDSTKIKGDISTNVSKITYLNNYDLRNQGGGNKASNSESINLGSVNFKEGEENEILYFYTFSSKITDGSQSPGLTLTLTDPSKDISDGSTNTTTITVDKISVQKNFITTVKGNFLHEIYPPVVPEEDPHKGAIFLDVLVSEKPWENLSSEWTSK